jgi:sugar lactone lactonase YvrE
MKPVWIVCIVPLLVSLACNAASNKTPATATTTRIPETANPEPPAISVEIPDTPLAPPSPTPLVDPTQTAGVEPGEDQPAIADLPVFWRVSIPSQDPPEEFGLPGGITAGNLGNIQLAEGAHGIYTYDVEGNLLKTIQSPEHSNLTDVTTDAFGNLIVTDSGYGWFIVLSATGEQIVAGGEEFDDDGPFSVAVSPVDGNLYLRDKERIRVYTSDTAEHLRDLPLDSGAYFGMAFDSAGNLYLAEQYSASVLKLDPANGKLIDTLGVPALADSTPRDLALDDQGNIYVLVNFSPGDAAVYMLDPQGNLLKRFGQLIYEPPEGQRQDGGALFDPISLAVTQDGRFLVICDAYEDITYLTAYNIKD